MEALMTLNCSNYSKNIVDIIKMFQQIGWDIYNLQGKVEYLPMNDINEYDWQCEEMSVNKLFNIISNKIAKKEQVGVNLFHNNGIEGISFMAYGTDQIILSIAINRKIIKEKYTDMVWYLENIIYKLFDAGVKLLSYKMEEFED